MQTQLRAHRQILGIPQVRLAKVAQVSLFRFKQFECGQLDLEAGELARIRTALHQEASRLRARIDLVSDEVQGQPGTTAGVSASGKKS